MLRERPSPTVIWQPAGLGSILPTPGLPRFLPPYPDILSPILFRVILEISGVRIFLPFLTPRSPCLPVFVSLASCDGRRGIQAVSVPWSERVAAGFQSPAQEQEDILARMPQTRASPRLPQVLRADLDADRGSKTEQLGDKQGRSLTPQELDQKGKERLSP